MYVYGLLTEQGEKSAQFTIFGSYRGSHKWVVVQIDLKKVLGRLILNQKQVLNSNTWLHTLLKHQFKVDRLQIIVVAKNITVLQLFISRMPKMCAIPQLVSAPLNPIPTVEHFRRSHPQCEHSYGQHIYMSEENNAK